jgi:carbon monoxide dehydrogenase subunit G
MDMSGERHLAASRTVVWAALNDPEILRQCIPGCESLEKQSATEMTARVKLQIGPVRATFNGKVKLSDLDPPNSYRIAGEGNGGVAGYAKGGANVALSDEPGGTLMRYDVKADVGGKLAQLGGRLIDSTSKKLADDFFEKFSTLVVDLRRPRPPRTAASAAEPSASKKPGWFKRWFGKQRNGAAQA